MPVLCALAARMQGIIYQLQSDYTHINYYIMENNSSAKQSEWCIEMEVFLSLWLWSNKRTHFQIVGINYNQMGLN